MKSAIFGLLFILGPILCDHYGFPLAAALFRKPLNPIFDSLLSQFVPSLPELLVRLFVNLVLLVSVMYVALTASWVRGRIVIAAMLAVNVVWYWFVGGLLEPGPPGGTVAYPDWYCYGTMALAPVSVMLAYLSMRKVDKAKPMQLSLALASPRWETLKVMALFVWLVFAAVTVLSQVVVSQQERVNRIFSK